MLVKGPAGNPSDAPGLLYIQEGDGSQLQGFGLDEPAFISIDWFRIFDGKEKTSAAFSRPMALFFWLLPFAGLFSLAWNGFGRKSSESE